MKKRGESLSERPTALITGGSKGIGFVLAKQFTKVVFAFLSCREGPDKARREVFP